MINLAKHAQLYLASMSAPAAIRLFILSTKIVNVQMLAVIEANIKHFLIQGYANHALFLVLLAIMRQTVLSVLLVSIILLTSIFVYQVVAQVQVTMSLSIELLIIVSDVHSLIVPPVLIIYAMLAM